VQAILLWQQNLGSLPDSFGESWGISHLSCLPDGRDAQAKARSREGVDLSTVSRYATGVWDENNGGVYLYPMADDCNVSGNPPDC
jgi:hypothetical protein